jgi:nuclear protein 1
MEEHFDEYEHWNFDHENEKHMYSGKSGKGRSKTEASLNTNHYDTNGHTRKAVTKLQNNHKNNVKRGKSD